MNADPYARHVTLSPPCPFWNIARGTEVRHVLCLEGFVQRDHCMVLARLSWARRPEERNEPREGVAL